MNCVPFRRASPSFDCNFMGFQFFFSNIEAPEISEADLFERLVLEINQAGLSWLTVLKKRDAFRHAFDHFEVDRVLTNCLRVIRNAWHFYYAVVLVVKVVCGSFGIALLTP